MLHTRPTQTALAQTALAALPRPRGLLESPARNLVFGALYMAVVMAAATVSYVAAGWNVADAVYMVVLTVYTVGYDEVRPIDTPTLRAITIGTIVLGCTGMIFLTGALVQFITVTQINQLLGNRRMTNQIDKLADHVIICGLGRIGQMLAAELHAARATFVVLERDDARIEQARALGYLCLQVDATEEDALRAAGVNRARALATVLPNDAANVFITLTARSLNPALEIIARGEAGSTESKLRQAGATRVVMPTHIGAQQIAEMILYHETARFVEGSERMRDFESVLRAHGLNLDVMPIPPASPALGQTIETLERAGDGGLFVVQVNRRDGAVITRPEPTTRIEAGDSLVMICRSLAARAVFEPGGRLAFRRSAR